MRLVFIQQLFKINPKVNAIIEINNLLGTKYLQDIKANDILEICTRHKTNLRGNLLKKAKELYYTLFRWRGNRKR